MAWNLIGCRVKSLKEKSMKSSRGAIGHSGPSSKSEFVLIILFVATFSLILAFLIFNVGVYVLNLNLEEESPGISNLGSFSDFYGLILGLPITAISALVALYLAFRVEKISKEQVAIENHLLKIEIERKEREEVEEISMRLLRTNAQRILAWRSTLEKFDQLIYCLFLSRLAFNETRPEIQEINNRDELGDTGEGNPNLRELKSSYRFLESAKSYEGFENTLKLKMLLHLLSLDDEMKRSIFAPLSNSDLEKSIMSAFYDWNENAYFFNLIEAHIGELVLDVHIRPLLPSTDENGSSPAANLDPILPFNFLASICLGKRCSSASELARAREMSPADEIAWMNERSLGNQKCITLYEALKSIEVDKLGDYVGHTTFVEETNFFRAICQELFSYLSVENLIQEMLRQNVRDGGPDNRVMAQVGSKLREEISSTTATNIDLSTFGSMTQLNPNGASETLFFKINVRKIEEDLKEALKEQAEAREPETEELCVNETRGRRTTAAPVLKRLSKTKAKKQ